MKKFLFDTHNFDKEKAEKPAAPVFSEEQVGQARDQALAQGRSEGLKEASARQEEAIARLLDRLAVSAERLAAEEDRREIEQSMAATRLAMKIARKLFPSFAETYALGEIERVILEAVTVRRDEPRIAVSVPPRHLEALKARIDSAALERGFAGKVILIADDRLGPADCRVEWADGGAERLYERLLLQIENEFAKAISGMEILLAGPDKPQTRKEKEGEET